MNETLESPRRFQSGRRAWRAERRSRHTFRMPTPSTLEEAKATAAANAPAGGAKAAGDFEEAKCFELTFESQFKGQLHPSQPTEAERAALRTSSGPLLISSDGIVVQRGPYDAIWLRRVSGSVQPAVATLVALVERLQKHMEAKQFRGAVYIGLAETAAGDIGALLSAGFKFSCYRDESMQRPPNATGRPPSAGESEFVYHKWFGAPTKRVPAFATSIEGASGMLFSPRAEAADPSDPGDDVLLVWEHHAWRCCSGAVADGETMVETIRRAVSREVGLTLDSGFATVYLGGWQASRAREALINGAQQQQQPCSSQAAAMQQQQQQPSSSHAASSRVAGSHSLSRGSSGCRLSPPSPSLRQL